MAPPTVIAIVILVLEFGIWRPKENARKETEENEDLVLVLMRLRRCVCGASEASTDFMEDDTSICGSLMGPLRPGTVQLMSFKSSKASGSSGKKTTTTAPLPPAQTDDLDTEVGDGDAGSDLEGSLSPLSWDFDVEL